MVTYIGAEDRDLVEGQQVGEYVVAEKIGEGGFGTVFRATHPLIGKQVAIKVLSRQYSANPEMVSRFVAEAAAVNQIQHRNIIDIFSFGQLPDGRHYYIMELLAGRPLDELLKAGVPVPLETAIPILRGVARALDAAHGHGIVHRDIKPENIFLLEEEGAPPFPKLLDFGIAKLMGDDKDHGHKTRTGVSIGTPFYMAPEQCRGKDVDHRADIYAFGIVTYLMLTGQVPFDGDDHMEILIAQVQEEPAPPSSIVPSLPSGIDEAIAWMMKKDAALRPENLVTAVQELEDAASGGGIHVATTHTPFPSVGPATTAIGASPGGGKGNMGLAILGVLAVAGMGAYLLFGGSGKDAAVPASAAAPVAKLDSADAAVAVQPPSDGAVVTPPVSKYVTVDISNVPSGTEVYSPSGLIGVAPAKVQLERGEEPISLTFKADGYKTKAMQVSVSEDSSLDVEGLESKKRRVRRGRKRNTGASNNSRNTIDDAFGKK